MKKKYEITVRDGNGKEVERIKRVMIAGDGGNFQPFFCRYKGKQYLLRSDMGDLSDPFRRSEDYADTFHIIVMQSCRCGHPPHYGQCPAEDGCWCNDSFATAV